MVNSKKQLVIITGMSGAGKTVAIQSFEDMGYFVVDNLPPKLLRKFWNLMFESGHMDKVAVVIDLRSRDLDNELLEAVSILETKEEVQSKIIYLNASNEVLVKRYNQTRRSHPLAMSGRLLDGINKERQLLTPVMQHADLIIDTSNIKPKQLRQRLIEQTKGEDLSDVFHIEVMSFGFKYGLPIDADLVFDVRFLPNPYYIPEMKPLTGLQKPVSEYVLTQQMTTEFYDKLWELLVTIIPGYIKEGKTNLTIAIGCTGGQHRSVALAEKLGQNLMKDYPTDITHREIWRYQGDQL
ncbi:RNase adapter RapZ [Holzapfeliella sp. He02]|uniref:RNase adapter RapZ n=1 Tax=Holzapfeliella saturejae TaxID=3082953 RepID=A0ABU8SFR0_9LACO